MFRFKCDDPSTKNRLTATQVTQKLLPEVPAHDAVDEDADGGVEGHQEAGDHADDDKPALRGEAVDLAHVDVRD